jgi:glycosyltransferase involved in cell wall biosynthesis
MRLLVITFEMDATSPVLAWQASVAVELARRCETLTVLTHKVGVLEHQPNMKVVTFPSALQRAPLRWIGGRALLNVYVWHLWRRERFDAVFIHMNMEWAYRLFPAFRILRLPVLLWYAHGSVTRRLRLAHYCASSVITSTADGFRIQSSKVHVIGQGIDTRAFRPQKLEDPQSDIITVSRLSRRKRIERLVETVAALRELRPKEPFRLRIIGSPLTEDDRAYADSLRVLALQLGVADIVDFVGHIPARDIPQHYRSAFVHVNVSTTGSMDKTVLESLACGCPVLTSNEAFRGLFRTRPQFLLADDSPASIAARILDIYDRRSSLDVADVRSLVHGHHDLESYCARVVGELARLLDISRRGPCTAGTTCSE